MKYSYFSYKMLELDRQYQLKIIFVYLENSREPYYMCPFAADSEKVELYLAENLHTKAEMLLYNIPDFALARQGEYKTKISKEDFLTYEKLNIGFCFHSINNFFEIKKLSKNGSKISPVYCEPKDKVLYKSPCYNDSDFSIDKDSIEKGQQTLCFDVKARLFHPYFLNELNAKIHFKISDDKNETLEIIEVSVENAGVYVTVEEALSLYKEYSWEYSMIRQLIKDLMKTS